MVLLLRYGKDFAIRRRNSFESSEKLIVVTHFWLHSSNNFMNWKQSFFREYLMIYRGPGFLESRRHMIWLLLHQPTPPSLISKLL